MLHFALAVFFFLEFNCHFFIGNEGRVAFPVFRACGGLLLWHWCWGISGKKTIVASPFL
jgi:hypothetical protein